MTIERVAEPDLVQGLGRAGAPLGSLDAAHLQRQFDVAERVPPREQRVARERIGGIAPTGLRYPAGHLQDSGSISLQTCNHVEESGLAAAAGSDDGDELAIADRQVDAREDVRRTGHGQADLLGKDRRRAWHAGNAGGNCRGHSVHCAASRFTSSAVAGVPSA